MNKTEVEVVIEYVERVKILQRKEIRNHNNQNKNQFLKMVALKVVIIKLEEIHHQFLVYQQTSQQILKLKNNIKNQIFLLYKIKRL
jgi:hypothetical protein